MHGKLDKDARSAREFRDEHTFHPSMTILGWYGFGMRGYPAPLVWWCVVSAPDSVSPLDTVERAELLRRTEYGQVEATNGTGLIKCWKGVVHSEKNKGT